MAASSLKLLSTFPLLNRIAERASVAPSATAITDVPHSLTVDYSSLVTDIVSLASQIITVSSPHVSATHDLAESRVAILCNKGYLVPLSLLAVWTAGGLAVPLLSSLPVPEQSYIVTNADCSIIICDEANRVRADLLAGKIVNDAESGEKLCAVIEISVAGIRRIHIGGTPIEIISSLNPLGGIRRAMMLYTSGTTGRPKGVVTRHSALAVQITSIVQAWHWTSEDNLLHILPLNHLHGIVVALLPTLWSGASVEMWERFDGTKIWYRWININGLPPITMFFGVPTVYSKLIQAHLTLPEDVRRQATEASARLRVQVSGSAPLPESVKAMWEKEGGVGGGMILLERYGMTETGIIASTGWEAEKRVKGCVGYPMPSVEIRLWDIDKDILVEDLDTPGEVQVRGPGIFIEYWHLPEATTKEFKDGWFKTGDVAVRTSSPDAARGQYRILGRNSVDIIKSGGEKISAVEIERAILELHDIEDVAVVGVDDVEWGQLVAACIVTSRPDLTLDDLRAELRHSLAAYKLPRKLKLYQSIPRNGMGKIQKKLLVVEAFST